MAELAAALPCLDDVEVVLVPAGGEPLRVTPVADSMRWTSAAVGGFGSFSCQFEGLDMWARRDRIAGAMLRATLDQRVIWEGQLEDPELNLTETGLATAFTGFGMRRLLSEHSLRRVWVDRDVVSKFAVTIPFYPLWVMRNGQIDEADSTLFGLEIRGDDSDPGQLYGVGATGPWFWFPLPPESSFIRPTALILTVVKSGTADMTNVLPSMIIEYSGFADEYTTLTSSTSGTINTFLFDQARTLTRIRIGLRNNGGAIEPTDGDFAQFTALRFLHAMTTEDEAGGYHGGTLLRDLLSFVPGLQPGHIVSGSEFLIQQLEHHARTSALAVVEEIAAYYQHEWAVWEDSRFDWKPPSDEPSWVVSVADLTGLNLRSSLDGTAKTTYLQYSDVLYNNRANEEDATSTDPRNPYVKQGRVKDEIISAGFPMTARSAAALATKLNGISGGPPHVTGRLTLHADTSITHAQLGPMPAWTIRAGENVLIHDLPVAEPLRQGLDGATLFHIVTCDVNIEDKTVTLELDGQTRRADVLLARLAAATRVVTG